MSIDGWRVSALAVAIAVLFASGVAAVAWEEFATSSSAASPETWDPRVQPLVDYVAEERGLEFDHPVAVEFLTDEEFSEETTGEDESLTDADREEAERFSRLFRAVGLVSGDFDMVESGNQLVDEGVLALYDPASESVLVRGTDLTPKLRATLVHELTHALQDQHFDLSRIDELETSGAQLAFRAVAEGDADRIEAAYVENLPSAQEDEYYEESDSAPDLEGVPLALLTYFSAPYALGDPFVALVEEIEGSDGVNQAFADPPTTEENLLDPFTYLDGDDAVPVDQPTLTDDEEEFDSGDWGALAWLFMLGARIDPHAALRAADGWGGDAYVAYERNGTTCVRVAYTGQTPTDTDEMAAALDQWVAAMPPGAASTERDGEILLVNACDPGADTDAEFAPDDAEILVLPAARAGLAFEALANGRSPEAARCIGQRTVDSFSLEELSDFEAATERPGFLDRVRAIIDEC